MTSQSLVPDHLFLSFSLSDGLGLEETWLGQEPRTAGWAQDRERSAVTVGSCLLFSCSVSCPAQRKES